jgi:mobilization protein NikA
MEGMMAGLSTEVTAPVTIARPAVRSRQIGVRVTEEEYQALERNAWSVGQKVADWARDQLLQRMERAEEDRLTAHVFTELVGLQMLLMGCFSPLLQGQRLSPEQYQEIVRAVQSGKGKRAKELLTQRLGQEEK